MSNTHAIYIDRERFYTPELAQQYVEQCAMQEGKHIWAGMAFKRFIPDHDPCLVIEYHYVPLNPIALDNMFEAQMAAKDAMFATPGSKKLGRTTVGTQTHIAGMLDDEDEDY